MLLRSLPLEGSFDCSQIQSAEQDIHTTAVEEGGQDFEATCTVLRANSARHEKKKETDTEIFFFFLHKFPRLLKQLTTF